MGQPYAYAKNLATFAPMGPWIVTKKELPDPRNLKMDVRIPFDLGVERVVTGAVAGELHAGRLGATRTRSARQRSSRSAQPTRKSDSA